MKRKIIRFIILFCIFFPLLLKGVILSRDDVIATASQYVNIGEWTPKTDYTEALSPTWHSWYTTLWGGNDSLNISPPYNRLAYCWSGFDTPSGFKNRVEYGFVPAGGQGTGKLYNYSYIRPYIAGIDCAGFVLKCWGISSYNTWMQLKYISIGINPSKLKRGDWLRIVGKHQLLYESGNIHCPNVYESTSDYHDSNNNHYPGVQHNYGRNINSEFNPYSIFPQFDHEDPFDGKILSDSSPWTPCMSIEISIIIYASGSVSEDGVGMFVDWIKETNTEIIVKSDTSVQFVSYDSTSFNNALNGEVNVEVTARANSMFVNCKP